MTVSVNSRKIIHFRVLDSAPVDGSLWYTVRIYGNECHEWVEKQPTEYWYRHLSQRIRCTIYDVNEKLYAMLILRWA